jgi:hypothetical protein
MMAMERGWKAGSVFRIEMVEEEEETAIPPPQTPLEPMEYLSRSWSVSASEISKILVGGAAGKRSFGRLPLPEMAIPEAATVLATTTAIVPSHRHHVSKQSTHHLLDLLVL